METSIGVLFAAGLGACSLLFQAPPTAASDANNDASNADTDAMSDLCEAPGNLLVRATFADTETAGLEFSGIAAPGMTIAGLETPLAGSPCQHGLRLLAPEGKIEVSHAPAFELDQAMFRVVFTTSDAVTGQQALFDKDGNGPGPGDVTLDLLGDGTGSFRLVFRLQDGQDATGSAGAFLCSSLLAPGTYEARVFIGGSTPLALSFREWNGSYWNDFVDAVDTSPITIFGDAHTCGYEAASSIILTTALLENFHSLSLGSHSYLGKNHFDGLLRDFSMHTSRITE